MLTMGVPGKKEVGDDDEDEDDDDDDDDEQQHSRHVKQT
jgi:hypothetical protein